jgi:hypothetical protein
VNPGLNKNQTELGILILAITLQMLTNLNSLLDKHVQILWDLRSKPVGLEDTYDLLSSDGLDLCDTIGITKNDSNLGRGETLLCELANVLLYISRGDFEP